MGQHTSIPVWRQGRAKGVRGRGQGCLALTDPPLLLQSLWQEPRRLCPDLLQRRLPTKRELAHAARGTHCVEEPEPCGHRAERELAHAARNTHCVDGPAHCHPRPERELAHAARGTHCVEEPEPCKQHIERELAH